MSDYTMVCVLSVCMYVCMFMKDLCVGNHHMCKIAVINVHTESKQQKP